MNCKHVQELLPLYVGRDLEGKRAQLVSAHVHSCAECAGAADEYRKSAQLLQLFAPPAFSEGVYDGIRRRVLREIEQETSRSIAPALPSLVANLFRPRLRWAVATALLLAISISAFYFITNQRHNQQVAGRGGLDVVAPDKNLVPVPSPSSKPNQRPPGLVDRPHQTQRRNSPAPVPNRERFVPLKTPDPPALNAQASPELNNLSQPNNISTRVQTIPEKTLRVEMQTKDPNIRIIWFSPQRTKHDSPGKSSKRIQEVRSDA